MLITLETFKNYSHTKYHDMKQLVPNKFILLTTIQFQSYYQNLSDLCTGISYNQSKGQFRNHKADIQTQQTVNYPCTAYLLCRLTMEPLGLLKY